MKYLPQILIFLAWPVFIYLSYKLCFWAVKKFENKIDASGS